MESAQYRAASRWKRNNWSGGLFSVKLEVALPSKEKVLDDIIQVLQDSHRARLVYRSAEGQRSALSVQPLSIAIYDHQLYLIARRTDGTFHPYRFARIEGVTRLPQRAQYPPQTEYDPEQVFRDSIGVYVGDRFPVEDVELLVSKRWKTFMESHRWHRSQRLISTNIIGRLLRAARRTPIVAVRLTLRPRISSVGLRLASLTSSR